MMSHASSHPVYGFAGFLAFALGFYLMQRRIEKWRIANGIAPPPSNTREGNRQYKQWLRKNMPSDVRRQAYLWSICGFVLAIVGMFLAQ
jgi:hypothetical protein